MKFTTQAIPPGKVIVLSAALALCGFFSFQYVAAQTATSSEPTATSTPSESIQAPAAPVSISTASTTESVAAPAAPSEPPVSESTAAVADIMSRERMYLEKTGKYLQVLPGNILPSYENGTVADKLGQTIPNTMRVDVYESPHGIGYQISYEENNTVYSIGHGPEAAARTYTIALPVPAATSTVQ